jgi:hypothetical protein
MLKTQFPPPAAGIPRGGFMVAQPLEVNRKSITLPAKPGDHTASLEMVLAGEKCQCCNVMTEKPHA